MKILIVEDDEKIASFLTKGLDEEGFATDRSADGMSGLQMATSDRYDAAIVDVMLPGMDGLSLVAEMRRRGVQTPVLFLSAKSSVEDRVKGLQTGDDYLTKPFSFVEVVARIHSLIRRSNRTADVEVLRFEDLELDVRSRQVKRAGRPIELRPRELLVLEMLMRHPGRVVSKTAILEKVYDYWFDPQTNVVDVLVHRLRTRLDKDFEPKLIHTVRGAGYVLRKEP
jgi:two-component system, OmpR family, response regulator